MAEKALIVLAHPAERSLCRMFAQTVQDTLNTKGLQTQLLDLCREGFDPVLNPAERAAYYSNKPNLDFAGTHAKDLVAAETLVLVFPTWWFGLPAILKGWLDRTFAPGIAFDHASDFGPIKPRLTNLKHIVVITTLGSPAWIDWLIMRRPVRRVLKTAVFGFCAPQAKFTMLSLYAAENPAPERVMAFRARINSVLK